MDRPGLDGDEVSALRGRLAREPAVLVTVTGGGGSLPREAGAWMAVFADSAIGSVGGGHLEWQACGQARQLLQDGAPIVPLQRRWSLGPSLGQCCGGVAELRFESLDAPSLDLLLAASRQARTPVAVFGAGHVGRALVRALLPLPFSVQWVDSRDAIFPDRLPDWVRTEQSEPVQHAVSALVPGSCVLVMSFSHAEDLDIVAACLRRWRAQADLPFIGLIGSGSKWATFRHRLADRGFTPGEMARVTCPVGLPGISGKQPEVIAASVAAQLLVVRDAQEPEPGLPPLADRVQRP